MGHIVQSIHSYQFEDITLVTIRIKADNYFGFFPLNYSMMVNYLDPLLVHKICTNL